MKKNKNKKWFTLVELIVVITILVILGTISFLSFQSVTSDARDGKRTSDLANISQAIWLNTVKWVPIKSFVTGTASTINLISTGATSTFIRIAWIEWYNALSGVYVAGDVNYTLLGMKKEDASDPVRTDIVYKIGVTDYNKDFYELAATIENGWNPDAIVAWTWSPRISTLSKYSGDQVWDTFYLSWGVTVAATNLRPQDMVRFNSSSWATDIFRIVRMNGNAIQLDRDTSTSLGSTIFLHRDETAHLIRRWKTNFNTIRVGDGPDYTPYKFN